MKESKKPRGNTKDKVAATPKADVLIDGIPIPMDPDWKPDPLRDVTYVAPAAGKEVLKSIQQSVAVLNAGRRFYFVSDEALRDSRKNARDMENNLAIKEPLQARNLAVAQMPWSVEPPDKKDEIQAFVAGEIEDIIRSIPKLASYIYDLLQATWYGRYAVQNLYKFDWTKGFKRLIVYDWQPIHGDSLVYKWDTNAVAIRVGLSQAWGSGSGLDTVTSEPADVSRAHVLTPWERESFCVHTHMLLPGDFFDPMQMGNVRGVGIRSFVYWTYWLMDQCTRILTEYMERMGTGFTIFKFASGNKEAYEAVNSLAQAETFSNIILWPTIPGEDDPNAIQRIEPSLNAITNLLKVLNDYWGAQIRRFIQGQDSTSESKTAGIGSGLSELHAMTFQRLIKFDADNLADTLTQELVRVIQKYTFPETDFHCRFRIHTDKPDPREYLESAKLFFDMGGELDMDEVSSTIGYSKPTKDSAILSKYADLERTQSIQTHFMLEAQEQGMMIAGGGAPGAGAPGGKNIGATVNPTGGGGGWSDLKHPRGAGGTFAPSVRKDDQKAKAPKKPKKKPTKE